ncbi:DUF1642 domain-containing protein [Streptococcus sp. Marseille-Q5855]|uniref:DUF1642 domain-containing protein n=1 Tax=Streptococcus sp. Marseille-Q5855 TaxID=2972781 RepID=UPI0021C9F244|nr:DUF1642 domain-containing protein [Streptococcus sp. Marseille-Q5855]
MNKQELIEKYEAVECLVGIVSGKTILKSVLKDLKQLDEPEKVKVPQFVAEKIEYFKKTGDWDLFQAMDYLFGKKEIREWLEDKNNQETFARAWLNGYEVEEERRYRVKIKGNIKENMLVYGELLERYYFTKSLSLDNAIYSHTRKELEEAGFGWVFDCPGIEIEEVE